MIIGAGLTVCGAFLGFGLSILRNWLKEKKFERKITMKLLGDYAVTLKNGNPYPDDEITWAKITKAKNRSIYFEMEFKSKSEEHDFGNSEGEVVFSTDNYGRGWYKHLKEPRYGFIELFIMSETQIAVCRKFTTDDTEKNKFKSVEVSFIWKKK